MDKDTRENISEFYFKDLHKTKNPGKLLTTFLCEVLEKEPNRSDYMKMNKLIKMYGRESTFFAILNLFEMDIEGDYYGLLLTMTRRRLEKMNKWERSPTMLDLGEEMKKQTKLRNRYEKQRKVKK